MTPDPALLEQLRLLFGAELEEQAAEMNDCLIALEAHPDEAAYAECLERLFRAAHNIKGAARGVDARFEETVAHALESVFSGLRRREKPPCHDLVDLCLLGVDALVAGHRGQPLPLDEQVLLARLSAWDSLGDHFQEMPARDVPPPAPMTPPATKAPSGEDGLVRLAQGKLNRLSALVEELQAARIEMDDHWRAIQQCHESALEIARQLQGAASGGEVWLERIRTNAATLASAGQRLGKQMRDSNSRLGVVCGRLEDQVRQIRLVPVGTVLLPLARSVRDIAQELGKQVAYEVVGDDFELDRPVLEGVKDPLIHLIRNAIDHGIESPAERLAAGKEAVGNLCITVAGHGARIVMTVEDDGRGMVPEHLAAAAVRKGLLSEDKAAALSPREAVDLIFRPGFSSKDIITSVSGRGVGLDVVLSNLRALKGQVQVETVAGRGTCFRISLPLTLSTDHGLQVRAGDEDYVIPTTSVAHLLEIRHGDVVNVGGWPAILVNGTPVPVRPLTEVLDIADAGAAPGRIAVVVEKGVRRAALLVDDVVGEREIVVKRLRPPLVAVRHVIGGTLTGSGKVLVVLNPSDLVVSALRSAARGLPSGRPEAVRPRILVADDSITTRSLETSILVGNGFEVVQAVNGLQAWELLLSGHFSAVLTDVEMPGLNGFELTARIKEHPRLRAIPVVIVTSLATEEHHRRGAEAGAEAYIVKSEFETGNLLAILRDLLERSALSMRKQDDTHPDRGRLEGRGHSPENDV